MYVFLPHQFKGTHMSRFVQILNDHEKEITVNSFKEMLKQMVEMLEADSGNIEMRFPYFVNKKAPISGVESLLDYDVTLIGEINKGVTSTRIKILVPVTSLCPCSKSISDYGAHNQRSHVTINVKTEGFIWIEEIIDIVEKQASCQLYGLLKRPDEKYVTEQLMIILNLSRIWCAISPENSTRTNVSANTYWNQKILNRFITTPLMR